MPRPKRETLADRVLAMLATGAKPKAIADTLETSETYVHVCRSRARLAERGLRRSRLTRNGLAPALTEEERQQLHLTMGRKAASTRVRRQQILRGQQDRARQRAQEIQDERTRRQKELDDMIASSIGHRRAHVNRVLEYWKRQRGQDA